MTFNTAIDLDGSIQFSRRTAAKVYLRSWFIIDFIAALPVEYTIPQNVLSETTFRRLKLLRLIRLLRLFRISRIIRRIQNTVFIRSTMGALLRYILMVMFVSHWFSCIFHTIAMNDSTGRNWVKVANLQEPLGNKWDRYVAALYFAVMTLATIGYGDISGTNADERLFAVFAMIVGGGIFAYGITNIVELVSSLTIQETHFRQRMDEVNEYMNARELPIKLRMEIREFYHNTRLSRESKLNAEQNILNDLSSKLRSKIALSINDQFLRKFPFFTGSEPNFLLELALNMRMIHFAPLEDVIIEGEIGHEMFFIFRGAVEILHEGKQIGILGENQYFGEMAILSADNRRRATVRTLCFCELRMLSRNRFLEALAQFPSMQTKMALVAQSRQSPMKTVLPIVENEVLKESSTSSRQLDPVDTIHASNGITSVNDLDRSFELSSISVARSQSRLQQADQRTHLPYVNGRPAVSSARLGPSSRRSTASSTGISTMIASQLSETTARLEELSRRQEVTMHRIVKLQSQLSQL